MTEPITRPDKQHILNQYIIRTVCPV